MHTESLFFARHAFFPAIPFQNMLKSPHTTSTFKLLSALYVIQTSAGLSSGDRYYHIFFLSIKKGEKTRLRADPSSPVSIKRVGGSFTAFSPFSLSQKKMEGKKAPTRKSLWQKETKVKKKKAFYFLSSARFSRKVA